MGKPGGTAVYRGKVLRLLMVGLLAAGLGAGGPAWSAGPTPPLRSTAPKDRKSVIINPDWAELPSGDDIARFYPEHAQANGISGKAVISCSVTAEGALTDCTVVSETPPGEDFGAAAVRMAAVFRMKPKTRDGAPVEGGVVQIPIVFKAPPPVSGEPPGPPPEMPPLQGRFFFAGDDSLSVADADKTALVYVREPDGPIVDGRVDFFLVLMLPASEQPVAYLVIQDSFDCKGRQEYPGSMNLFSQDDKRLAAGRPQNPGWTPVRPGGNSRAFELACGLAKPDSPPLPDIAAVREDAKARAAAAGAS